MYKTHAHKVAARLLGVLRAKASAGLGAEENARPTRVVIDGPSGSGKTTFAEELAQEITLELARKLEAEPGAQGNQAASHDVLVLHSDDWVPGWEGLAQGSRITEQLITGKRDCYPRFDWVKYEAAEQVCPEPQALWIVEGSGSLTPATLAAADLTVWVEAPEDQAKTRALDRDGEDFAPWWETWKKQESHHATTNNPRDLAELTIDTGSPKMFPAPRM